MKRLSILSFCGLFLLMCPAGASDEPLLKNGDFSLGGDRPDQWRIRTNEPDTPAGEMVLDSDVYHAESPSVRLTNLSSDEYTFVSQIIKVEPDTPYVLQGWVKGKMEELAGDDAGGIRLAVADGINGNIFALSKRDAVTEDWQLIKVRFNSGENESIRIFLYIHHAIGVAWFDDVEIVKEE